MTGFGTSRIQETFDLSKFQVSESPKIWVFDNILSESLLSNVDYDFEHYNETNEVEPALETEDSLAPHFNEEGQANEKWVYMRPEDAASLVDTIKRLGHIRHSYQDKIAIMEKEKGAEDQYAHMDRYVFKHPEHLTKTVNASLLHDVGDGEMIPRVSFVINFSNEGGCRFPNGTTVKFIPAKRGRVVMFENYVKGGAEIDPRAEHFGVYGQTAGKRVLTAGMLYNGDGPDFSSSESSSEGFLYFPSGTVSNEANAPSAFPSKPTASYPTSHIGRRRKSN